MSARERNDELTLRAEETGTWKSCTNVDHIAKGRWGLLMYADWPAAKRYVKASKVKTGKSYTMLTEK